MPHPRGNAGEERAAAWAAANRVIVEEAPAIPWLGDQQLTVHSTAVDLVQDEAQAFVDLAFTSRRQGCGRKGSRGVRGPFARGATPR